MSGTGIEFVPNLPKCRVPVLCSYRSYLSIGYRYGGRTEQTPSPPGIALEGIPVQGVLLGERTELKEVSGTGIEFKPNLTGVFGRVFAAVPKTPVRFGNVFTEKIPPVYFGTYPTEHTLGNFHSEAAVLRVAFHSKSHIPANASVVSLCSMVATKW